MNLKTRQQNIYNIDAKIIQIIISFLLLFFYFKNPFKSIEIMLCDSRILLYR